MQCKPYISSSIYVLGIFRNLIFIKIFNNLEASNKPLFISEKVFSYNKKIVKNNDFTTTEMEIRRIALRDNVISTCLKIWNYLPINCSWQGVKFRKTLFLTTNSA